MKTAFGLAASAAMVAAVVIATPAVANTFAQTTPAVAATADTLATTPVQYWRDDRPRSRDRDRDWDRDSRADRRNQGVSRSLICLVRPRFQHLRQSCAAAANFWNPGEYCECRLYNYGPTVPGTIVRR